MLPKGTEHGAAEQPQLPEGDAVQGAVKRSSSTREPKGTKEANELLMMEDNSVKNVTETARGWRRVTRTRLDQSLDEKKEQITQKNGSKLIQHIQHIN